MSNNIEAGTVPEGMERYNSKEMGMNIPNDDLLNNIRQNIQRFLPQVKSHYPNPTPIAIVCGGPSLLDTQDELRDLVEDGYKLVAVNGTHDWLLDSGFRPSAMVMVDAREANVRFVQRPIPTCKYLIASQCHPSVFDALEGQKVCIWHAKNDLGEKEILDNYYLGNYNWVVGGSTVTLRAIWVMRILGFSKFDLFGFDSCIMNDKHHAYSQPENDASEIRKAYCAGREFRVSAWMLSQADDFMHFVKHLGDSFELNVHGDGLIAHIVRKGAEYSLSG